LLSYTVLGIIARIAIKDTYLCVSSIKQTTHFLILDTLSQKHRGLLFDKYVDGIS